MIKHIDNIICSGRVLSHPAITGAGLPQDATASRVWGAYNGLGVPGRLYALAVMGIVAEWSKAGIRGCR